MATTLWKQLLLNAIDSNANLKHSSFFQLATVGSNGRPANRTVVFRGFEEGSDKIQINTDCRSRKEFILWLENCRLMILGTALFRSSWEQFRFNGRIEIIDGSNFDPDKVQKREKAWFASSLRSRAQYLGPSPGLPCINEESSKESSIDPTKGPVDAFCLLLLDPEQIDYLNLKSNKRLIFRSEQSDERGKCWLTEEINP